MKTRTLLLAALAATACQGDPPPASNDAAPNPSSVAPLREPDAGAAKFSLELEDASVDQVLAVLRQASSRPVDVTAEARPIVDCAKVSIRHPAKMGVPELTEVVRAAIRPSGLLLKDGSLGFRVEKADDAPAPACLPAP